MLLWELTNLQNPPICRQRFPFLKENDILWFGGSPSLRPILKQGVRAAMDHSPLLAKSAAFPAFQRLLAWLCALLLAASTLPLYVLSLYNHPTMTITSSPQTYMPPGDPQPASGASGCSKSAASIRASRQGTYTGTILSNLQPEFFGKPVLPHHLCAPHSLCALLRLSEGSFWGSAWSWQVSW